MPLAAGSIWIRVPRNAAGRGGIVVRGLRPPLAGVEWQEHAGHRTRRGTEIPYGMPLETGTAPYNSTARART